jgi:hypothetical protein
VSGDDKQNKITLVEGEVPLKKNDTENNNYFEEQD